MKLYTEEQVRKAMSAIYDYIDFSEDEILEQLTPIKLPSDEEIIEDGADTWVFKTNSMKWSNNNDEAGDNFGSFIAGAKWMKEKILNQK